MSMIIVNMIMATLYILLGMMIARGFYKNDKVSVLR